MTFIFYPILRNLSRNLLHSLENPHPLVTVRLYLRRIGAAVSVREGSLAKRRRLKMTRIATRNGREWPFHELAMVSDEASTPQVRRDASTDQGVESLSESARPGPGGSRRRCARRAGCGG